MRRTDYLENLWQRSAIHGEDAREEPWIRRSDCAHAGAEYRSQQRHLQRHRWCLAQTASVSAGGSNCAHISSAVRPIRNSR